MKFKKRKASRRAGFFKKARSRRSGGSSDSLMMTVLSAGAYGAARPMLENWIQPVTSKIPVVGNYSDELVLGAAGYFLAKGKMPFLKGKTARSVGKAMLVIEAARVGSGLMSGLPVASSNQSSNSDITTGYN